MNKRYWGMSGVGSLAALAFGAACGNSFSGDDCKASRTCAETGSEGGAESGAEGGSADEPVGGAISGHGGGPDGTTEVGAGAGAGGASDGECHTDADCSNSDPNDGEEICNRGVCAAGNTPPTIVSFTPTDEFVAAEPDTTVVIEFSEALDPKTVTSTSVRLLDGTTPVPGTPACTNKTVTFTPDSPLTLLGAYTLLVTTDVTDAQGAPLVTEQSSTFVVRDGAWDSIDVVKGRIAGMSDALPMTSTGRTLLAWNGSGFDRCPATATWFLRGKPDAVPETFPTAGQLECENISSGANAAGVAALVWTSPSVGQGPTLQQYRADAWLTDASLLSKNISSSNFRVAVAPSGALTLFEHDPAAGSVSWTTDTAGKWPANANPLSTFIAGGRTSVAFDSGGKGLAVWRAQDPTGQQLGRIVLSKLTTASGKWAPTTDLPGSGSTTSAAAAQPGNPVVALDDKGDGLALWVDGTPSGRLMASRFIKSAWTPPEPISGQLGVDSFYDPPALVFDGQAFVAAWTAQDGSENFAYTARYDLKTGWGPYRKQQTLTADGTSAAKMPRLVSDGRGNVLLVFAKGAVSPHTLMYQRYSGGAWGQIKPVPGGTMYARDLHTTYDQVLTMSAAGNGLVSLAWANYDSDYPPMTGIRLASFY